MLDNKKELSKKSEYIFLLLLKFISISIFIFLVAYHIKLINHPFPTEVREGGDLLTMMGLSNNINPYSLSNQPIYFNPYGIVYPFFGSRAASFFGFTLFTGRFVSAMAICFSLFLVFIALRREKINYWYCFFGVIIFYANILFFTTPIVKPDSTGVTFFLLSILLPILFRYNYLSLFGGLIFCIISFYTKQYFVIGYLILILYVFIFKSIKKASIMFALFLILFSVSVYVIDNLFECYFYNTLVAQFLSANNDHLYALRQFIVFLATNLGLTLMLVTSSILIFQRGKLFPRSKGTGIKITVELKKFLKRIRENFNWEKGLLNYNLSAYAFLFAIIWCCLIFKLGGNVGTYMTYYYQLLLFPFIILILKQPVAYSRRLFFLFTALSMIISVSRYLYQDDYSNLDNANWHKMDSIIGASQNVFSTTEIAPLIIQHGGIPCNSGFTETFINSTVSRKINSLFSFTKKLKERDSVYNTIIENNIQNRNFDLLVLSEDYSNSNRNKISSNYTVQDSISLNFYHSQQKAKLYIWKPISSD